MDLLKSNDDILSYFSITHNDIEDIDNLLQLEFGLKHLMTKLKSKNYASQVLHEQYWNRTRALLELP